MNSFYIAHQHPIYILAIYPHNYVFTNIIPSYFVAGSFVYSGTPLNGHPSIADTHDKTDNSESPDCPSIDFNTSATAE